MAIVAQNQYVELEYRLRLDNGEWVRGSDQAPALLTFVAGCGELMPALERRLWGLSQEDSLDFIIPAGKKPLATMTRKMFRPGAVNPSPRKWI